MGSEADALRIVVDWAAANPKIRRIWILGGAAQDTPATDAGIDVAVEPRPVADSEESLPVWVANCETWRRQLQALTGRTVRLQLRDPDAAA